MQVVRERGCTHDFVDEGHEGSRENAAKGFRAGRCSELQNHQGLLFRNIIVDIIPNIIVHITGRVLLNLHWIYIGYILDPIIFNFPYWTILFRVSSLIMHWHSQSPGQESPSLGRDFAIFSVFLFLICF